MLEGQLEGLMCASTWDKEVTENIEGKRSDLKVSKMLKITVLMPERRRDMALVEAAATTLKSSNTLSPEVLFPCSSGSWCFVLSKMCLSRCQAVISLSLGSWWRLKSVQRHNFTDYFPASGPKFLLIFIKSRGPGCFILPKLPSTSWSVISFLRAVFLSAFIIRTDWDCGAVWGFYLISCMRQQLCWTSLYSECRTQGDGADQYEELLWALTKF